MHSFSEKYQAMTTSEKRCCNKLEELGPKILVMNLTEIAESCHASTATLNRTIKKLGFKNLKAYKSEVDTKRNYSTQTVANISPFETALCNLITDYDQSLISKVADVICSSSTIYIIGFGITTSLAFDMSLHLRKLLKNAIYINDSDMLEIISNAAPNGNELVIYISYSGSDFDMERLSLEQKHVRKQVIITAKTNSPVGNNCDFSLNSCTYAVDDFLNSRIPLSILTTKILLEINSR